MAIEVQSVLKIGDEEVTEDLQVGDLRFYTSKYRDSCYVAKNGKVIVRIDADCNQNTGFISEVIDLVNTKKDGE